MSSCIGQSPRYSPGKPILEEWYDCVYIYIYKPRRLRLTENEEKQRLRYTWSVGVSIVDEEEEFRDLKTSRWKIRLLAWKAREGSRGGNEGASSDWSGREEIASRLVIITPLTRLPLPPIVLSIIFVIELLATKSPSNNPPPPPFLSTSPVYLVQSRPTATVSLSSTSISSRVQRSIFDTRVARAERTLIIDLPPTPPAFPRYTPRYLRLTENTVYFFLKRILEQDIIFTNFKLAEDFTKFFTK